MHAAFFSQSGTKLQCNNMHMRRVIKFRKYGTIEVGFQDKNVETKHQTLFRSNFFSAQSLD